MTKNIFQKIKNYNPISDRILKISDLKLYELINNYLKEMLRVCPNKKRL